jgi:hypothetical protein
MMVSSTVKDNPYLWNNDPDYVTWLLSLPEVLKKAWYEGCWDIAIGSFFGDVWDARKHVVRRIEPRHVPKDWEIRRAFDWGSSTPFCLLWYTISDGDPIHNGEQFPKGAIIILWEFYGQREGGNLNEGMKWSSIQVAQAIRRKEIEMGIFDRVIAGPADNQIYANTDGEDSNLYINFEREGVLFTRSNKSPGSAKVGWEQIRTRMVGRDGLPLIYLTESCNNCIRTIPELARHPTKMDDIDDGQEDHCFVAGTMVSMADGTEKPIELVEIGDLVKTQYGFHEVEACGMTNDKAMVIATLFDNGNKLECTLNHPFIVFDEDDSCYCMEAVNLLTSDRLLCSSGAFTNYIGFKMRDRAKVYNLTVKDDHTYFANGILVHNCGDVVKYLSLHHPINLNQKGIGEEGLNKSAQTRLK